MPDKVPIVEEFYCENDLILGCEVNVVISDDYVNLKIGGRDHRWHRKTGAHDSGATLNEPIPTVKGD